LMLAAAKARVAIMGETNEAAAKAALPETKPRLFTLSSLARAQTVGGTGTSAQRNRYGKCGEFASAAASRVPFPQ
jgi:hypothetical protein